MDTGSCLDRPGAPVIQNVRKSFKNGGPGVPFGSTLELRRASPGGSEPPWGRFGPHPELPGLCFSQEFSEKCDLCISTPLSNRIATWAGPGAQVGATWAPKSSPIGPEWPQSGKSEGPGRSSLAGRFGLAVGAMETNGNQPNRKSSQGLKSI